MKWFFFILTMYLVTIMIMSCEDSEMTSRDTPNKLYAYPNSGNIVYLIDYKTFEVVGEIKLNIPESIGLFGITLSTNKDYLVFNGEQLQPPFSHFIVSYNIRYGLEEIFATDFDSVSAPRISSALDQSNPGLVYLYSHYIGLYTIDFLKKQVMQCLFEYHGQGLDVFFYNTPNALYTALLKQYSNPSYSAIEFYQQGFSLQNLLFVFNENDEYEMSIYDVDFSENDEFMYVSYQLSERKSREIESYFAKFDLNNKELTKTDIRFPWSLNPYYIEFSQKRNEAYLVGAYDQFYIVNTENNTLVDSVTIIGKIEGPSRILTDPDEDVAFVSCWGNDKIFVIDLNRREIIENIQVSRPYEMIIP